MLQCSVFFFKMYDTVHLLMETQEADGGWQVYEVHDCYTKDPSLTLTLLSD